MRRISFAAGIAAAVLVVAGCGQNIEFARPEVAVNNDNQVAVAYHNKDVSQGFREFLKNPAASSRSALEDGTATPEEMAFAQLWDSLTEEERRLMVENADSVEIRQDSYIAVDAESQAGRNALAGDTADLEAAAARYGFVARLEDWCGGMTVPASLVPGELGEELAAQGAVEVPAAILLEQYVQSKDWETVARILSHLGDPVSLSAMKNEAALLDEALNRLQTDRGGSRASSVLDYRENPLRENVGWSLPDGAVLLTSCREKPFIITGQWGHAGIFSQKAYKDNGNHDGVASVYSAQPNKYKKFPANMQPDRPGYACMDTVYMYTKQIRFAALKPKSYSVTKAKAAVSDAKRIFYDPWPTYFLPLWEIVPFPFFDTSHDLSRRNTYCSKVPYTAWRLQGVNMDSNTFAGNLVAPDDLYGSIYDRYKSFTIRFLWFSKTWRWKSYSAQSDLFMRLGS